MICGTVIIKIELKKKNWIIGIRLAVILLNRINIIINEKSMNEGLACPS